MDILLNDLSLHGQFHSIKAFEDAFDDIMRMRSAARRHQRVIKIHRGMDDAVAVNGESFRQILGRLDPAKRRAILSWKTQDGPFWEDDARHGGDDYLDCGGVIVTDTAVGEAACCVAEGGSACLASISPSGWTRSPVSVRWERPDDAVEASVDNFWDVASFDAHLGAAPEPLLAWQDLENAARAGCEFLVFTEDCFGPAFRHPFNPGTAGEILRRIQVLNELARESASGPRSARGQEIYEKHFMGAKAWFSDSSRAEKDDFETEMTFGHPVTGKRMFCPWHGKVKSPQMRIHYARPEDSGGGFIVAYVGMKITRY